MNLHDTQSVHGMKILEIRNFEGEQEFFIGHSYAFGSLGLTDLKCHDLPSALINASQYTYELDPQYEAVVECAEALYAIFDEVGILGLDELTKDLRGAAKSQGYDVYVDVSSDLDICRSNAERVFEFWESFYFDLMIGTTRMRYEISLSDDPGVFDENLSYDILGWISQFSLDKLHSIYAQDTSRTHLQKFSDRKFGGDLGL